MTTIKTVDGLVYFTPQPVPELLEALAAQPTPGWIECKPSGTLLSLLHVVAIEPEIQFKPQAQISPAEMQDMRDELVKRFVITPDVGPLPHDLGHRCPECRAGRGVAHESSCASAAYPVIGTE